MHWLVQIFFQIQLKYKILQFCAKFYNHLRKISWIHLKQHDLRTILTLVLWWWLELFGLDRLIVGTCSALRRNLTVVTWRRSNSQCSTARPSGPLSLSSQVQTYRYHSTIYYNYVWSAADIFFVHQTTTLQTNVESVSSLHWLSSEIIKIRTVEVMLKLLNAAHE